MKKKLIRRHLLFKMLRKKLIVMRNTILFLFISSFQIFASGGYAQNQGINLEMKNTSIEEVLFAIQEQSEFYFLFNSELIDVDKKIDINIEGETIDEILPRLFSKDEVKYLIDDRYIVLTPVSKEKDLTQPNQLTVSGVVTDESGAPLPGVNVTIKGTGHGTVTNVNGEYSVTNVPEDAIIQFSFIGMQSQEIPVSGRTTINTSMVQQSIGMNEVVVVGYGIQKKINLTGSVDVVKKEQIENRAVTNVSSALQGISPNLNITQNGFSTEPGGKLDMNIRGIGSLSGNSAPYVLVDGVPMDLNSINPNDIESITVLKDAAASAIYGARAPYGVILVTTKKGEMEDKASFSYTSNLSFSSPLSLPHLANSLDFAVANDQASVNSGNSPWFTDEILERMRQYQAGEIADETWISPAGDRWIGNANPSRMGNANNDWLYIYYDDLILRQKHDLSLSGGGKNNSYFISAGYWDQPGELRYGDQFYKRYNLTANLSSKVTNWLHLDFKSKYIKERNQYFNTRHGGWTRATMYHNFYRNNAYRPLYLPNGEFSATSYIPMLQGGKENHYTNSLIVSLGAEIEPVKNWITTLRYNYKDIQPRTDSFEKTVTGTHPNGKEYVIAFPIDGFQTRFSNTDYQMANLVSSYNITLNEHYFSVLAGFEQELNRYNSLWGYRDQIVTSNVPSLTTATGESQLDDIKSHWATRSFFGRFNYNYQEKYLIEINGRYDGTSRFEKGRRWGFFPSLSMGYVISKEAFWSSLQTYINSCKLRASWGSLGNQNVANYLYLPNMAINTLLPWIFNNERPNYIDAPSLVSPDLTWETSETQNIGLDISFLSNRLYATIDAYKRITTHMFGPAEAVPGTLGAGVPQKNNASLETTGFELSLLWKDRIGDDLSYSIGASLADNVSKVTKYNNPTKTLSTWYEGQILGEIWGLTTVGIYQSDEEAEAGPDQSIFYPDWGAGDIHYKDIDGDGEITRGDMTADDAGDYSIIGNSQPRYRYGITTNVTWKGFDFSMFWQGVGKRDYAFKVGDQTFFGFNGGRLWDYNVWIETLDYWRPADETNKLGPNTDAYYTKPYLSAEDDKNKQVQTRWTQNASYLRLKSVTLGYTIPQSLSQKVKISNVKIFITGENLITLTPLTKLADPEALNINHEFYGVAKQHALRKTYAIGLNVSF